MRYADGPSVECGIHIDAPAELVWDLTTDIELPTRFSSELRRVRWLDGAARPEVGARFEGYNENASLGAWRTVSCVVELVAPQAFAWAVIDPFGQFGDEADPGRPLATWRFDITEQSGGVLLRHSARLGPARSGLSIAIDRMPEHEEAIIDGRLAMLGTGMDEMLRGIKSLAEGASRSQA